GGVHQFGRRELNGKPGKRGVLMGNHSLVIGQSKEPALLNSARILVVASPFHAEALSQSTTAKLFPGLRIASLEPGEPVPNELLASAALAVIEVEPGNSGSTQRIAAV